MAAPEIRDAPSWLQLAGGRAERRTRLASHLLKSGLIQARVHKEPPCADKELRLRAPQQADRERGGQANATCG